MVGVDQDEWFTPLCRRLGELDTARPPSQLVRGRRGVQTADLPATLFNAIHERHAQTAATNGGVGTRPPHTASTGHDADDGQQQQEVTTT